MDYGLDAQENAEALSRSAEDRRQARLELGDETRLL